MICSQDAKRSRYHSRRAARCHSRSSMRKPFVSRVSLHSGNPEETRFVGIRFNLKIASMCLRNLRRDVRSQAAPLGVLPHVTPSRAMNSRETIQLLISHPEIQMLLTDIDIPVERMV